MDVKRLKIKHGATNGKLMAMMHPRTDVAAIETFFATIGAELALIICQSLRGCYSLHAVRSNEIPALQAKKWYAEILFWLIACYNTPMFAKTYHIGWKYEGYENDSLATRSYKGHRFRSEMLRFMDRYTLHVTKEGYTRRLPNGRQFSFMDVEPSYYWVCSDDPSVISIRYYSLKHNRIINRYPYPTCVFVTSSLWAFEPSYEMFAEYYDNGIETIISRAGLKPADVQRMVAAQFHIKSVD